VKRFLLLALLLDKVAGRAAEARSPAPLLFRVGSTIKSSAEVGRLPSVAGSLVWRAGWR
jgi:hypothetical protein